MSVVEPTPVCPVCGSLAYGYDDQSEGWHCEYCGHFEDETPEGSCRSCRMPPPHHRMDCYVREKRTMLWDRDGRPLTTDEWLDLRQRPFDEYRRVAVDQVGPVWISTVWVGCDTGDDPPLIFETRVDLDDTASRYYRYATEKEARDWHAAFVRAAWETCP